MLELQYICQPKNHIGLGKRLLRSLSMFLVSHRTLLIVFSVMSSIVMKKPSADQEYSASELRRRIGPSSIVVEVGGNKGGLTVILSEIVGPKGHVYTFEPNLFSYELLRIYTRKNNNVSTFNIGAGNRNGNIQLEVSGTADKGATIRHHSDSQAYRMDIKLVTLDHFLNLKRIHRVDVIFVDVEGAEAEVLEGTLHLLSTQIDLTIFVELHPKVSQGIVEFVNTFLAGFGFKGILIHKDYETVTYRYGR